jgi:hypothetical protein
MEELKMTETNRQEYQEKIDNIIEWTKTAPIEKVSAFYESEQVQEVMKRLEKNTKEYEDLIEKYKMGETK